MPSAMTLPGVAIIARAQDGYSLTQRATLRRLEGRNDSRSQTGPKTSPDKVSYNVAMVDRASPSTLEAKRRSRVENLRSNLTKLHLIGIARFIDRSGRRVIFAGVHLLRSLARVPLIGSGVDPLLARIDRNDHLHFDLTELLRVCSALSDEHLPYWLAGGWGLDALVGCETRRHGDLDFVVDRFWENLPKVAALLTGLGYRRKKSLGGTFWFPDAEVYEDARGHRIEILRINAEVLTGAEVLISPLETLEPASVSEPDQLTPLLLKQCTATGTLEGVAIPALSVEAQQLVHLGYEHRPQDAHAEDVIRLISMGRDGWTDSWGRAVERPSKPEARKPATLLLVPLFTFPPGLWRLCRQYHNDLDLIPPHVTVAFPFLPLESVTADAVRKLSKLFEETLSFDFELSEIRWFDTNVVYVAPSNEGTFRSIIETLQRMFPDFHPYDGAFDSVVPHVTLSEHGSLADRQAVGRQAPEYLPISARASHVWMMSNERWPDEWSIVKIFQLGPTAHVRPSDHLE
jgi:2'-5' RNA ligase